VFFEGERHDLSKTGGFGRKMGPPPGKPETLYECHPEDHAPAPSVRADFYMLFYMFHYVSIHFSFQLSTSKLQPQTTEEWLGVLEG
jgi:hypothetical protein